MGNLLDIAVKNERERQAAKLEGRWPVLPDKHEVYIPEGDDHESEATPWPSPPGEDAYYGIAGEIVKAVDPYTEADPIAVLMSLLVAFGNCIGRGAHFEVSGTRHGMNLFCSLVGATAGGRKGTSWGYVDKMFQFAAPDWQKGRVVGGLSSGEGLLWGVRDPITRTVPQKVDGKIVDYQEQVDDPGVTDKRLLCMETELGQTLQVLRREGNTLSAVLRQVWDGKEVIQTLTKNSKAQATQSHVSLLPAATHSRRYTMKQWRRSGETWR